jgi:hypothetical protein
MLEPRRVGSRRKISPTVHPDTVMRLDSLRARFQMPVGRILDRLVNELFVSYETGIRRCAHGGQCKIDLKDLPAVL